MTMKSIQERALAPNFVRVPIYGWAPAKRARDLREGDSIVRPGGIIATVRSVVISDKSVHLIIEDGEGWGGKKHAKAKRHGTLVAIFK